MASPKNYKNAVQVIMGITSTLFVYIMTIIYPEVLANPKKFGNNGIFIITLSTIYTVFFSFILLLYEKFIWKMLNRSSNFNGCWKMVIKYEFLEKEIENSEKLELPYIFESVFRIKQTPFNFSFSEGFSAPNEVWREKSVYVSNQGINMSYEVHRTDKKMTDALPAHMIGFEEINVTERDFWGRPKYMVGRLYHAALPDVPLYRGSTTYERISTSKYNALLEKMRLGKYKVNYPEKIK